MAVKEIHHCAINGAAAVLEELGQTQLFVRDPAGTAVELNFLD